MPNATIDLVTDISSIGRSASPPAQWWPTSRPSCTTRTAALWVSRPRSSNFCNAPFATGDRVAGRDACVLRDIVESDDWSILQQYSIPAIQSIGAGSYVQTVTLPFAPCIGPCTLTDVDILAEIGARIDADDPALPALATDTAGRLNTVFMVHFAANVRIVAQGSFNSCFDFLSVYEEFTTDAAHGSRVVPIAIVPDCGSDDFETEGASSALADIATDPQVSAIPPGRTTRRAAFP